MFHDPRHFAARELVKQTEIITAGQILAHSDPKTTKRYVHETAVDKYEAVQRFLKSISRTSKRRQCLKTTRRKR